jgi:hypothetical protein
LVWSPGSTFRTAFVVLRLHPSTCPFGHAAPHLLRRLVQVMAAGGHAWVQMWLCERPLG